MNTQKTIRTYLSACTESWQESMQDKVKVPEANWREFQNFRARKYVTGSFLIFQVSYI